MKCCIVKRNTTLASYLPLLVIVFLTLALAVLALKITVFLSAMVLFLGICLVFYLFPLLKNTEYEYNLEGDTFSVSLIRNKASRKELFSCDMAYLISCESYSTQFTSGEKIDVRASEKDAYIASFSEEGKTAAVLFSPDSDFMREMKLFAPSKVKINIM